jgi:hypothetical protein
MDKRVIKYKHEVYVDYESGVIINNLGEVEGYVDFNFNESILNRRDSEGCITEYLKSGQDDTPISTQKTLLEQYKDWKYYE